MCSIVIMIRSVTGLFAGVMLSGKKDKNRIFIINSAFPVLLHGYRAEIWAR
jgi:hypothetical protein